MNFGPQAVSNARSPTMNKREFLKATGMLGAASILPTGKLFGAPGGRAPAGACVLIPSETAGPFPLDLTANIFFFREDIRESTEGVPLRVLLRIIGLDNCEAMQNVRVNIWHCDADGVYSGYPGQLGGLNTTGQTFLRGYQITDNDGNVEFITTFPGWYNGRVCHIHFQVYVNSNYSAVSQLTFPIAEKQAIYTANPTLYPNGTDPLTPSQDGIFSDGYQYQLSTLTYNDSTQEYECFLEVAVQGTGSPTGLEELLNERQFSLGQNQPNPFTERTVVPITLVNAADLQLDLFDLQGRRVASVQRQGLAAGEHPITLDMHELGIPTASYIYQVQVTNADGVFRSNKRMTSVR